MSDPAPRSPVVVVPAMGVPARAYGRLAAALAGDGRRGVTVVELPTTGDVGYDALVRGPVGDAVAAAGAGDGRVVLVGHSLGGQLALLAAATRDDVGAVALPAAGTIHWRGFAPVTGLRYLAFSQFAAAVATVTGAWPGDRFRFGGRQPRRLITDWARIARTGRLAPRGGRDRYEPGLASLRVPVLSLTLEGDTYAPRSAADALLGAVPAAPVTRRHLGSDVLAGAVDHIGWLRDPGPVADAISGWLDDVGQRSDAAVPRHTAPPVEAPWGPGRGTAMRIEDVAGTDDASVLWTALLEAKDGGDSRLARAIEQRMRELAVERRFGHLGDDELRRRIASLRGNRAPEGMLAHSPDGGGVGGGGYGVRHTTILNDAIRADQHVGVEVTLAALEDELARRRARDA